MIVVTLPGVILCSAALFRILAESVSDAMNIATDVQPQAHRYTVDDLIRMVAAGIVMEDARVELIEGEIIDMPPIAAPHSGLVNRLNRLLVAATAGQAVVSVQNGLRLGDLSLPQPDFAVLLPKPHDYMLHLPRAVDTVLVIEVSHTTLSFDQNRKLPLYAAHGLPEAWVIDVTGQRILRYREPGDEGYRRQDEIAGLVELTALPGCCIDLTGLFD